MREIRAVVLDRDGSPPPPPPHLEPVGLGLHPYIASSPFLMDVEGLIEGLEVMNYSSRVGGYRHRTTYFSNGGTVPSWYPIEGPGMTTQAVLDEMRRREAAEEEEREFRESGRRELWREIEVNRARREGLEIVEGGFGNVVALSRGVMGGDEVVTGSAGDEPYGFPPLERQVTPGRFGREEAEGFPPLEGEAESQERRLSSAAAEERTFAAFLATINSDDDDSDSDEEDDDDQDIDSDNDSIVSDTGTVVYRGSDSEPELELD